MIKIKLEYDDRGYLIATNRRMRLPIGYKVEFTLPDGSVLACITVTPGSCDTCPFSKVHSRHGRVCPMCSYSGMLICPDGGYIVKSSNAMEEL